MITHVNELGDKMDYRESDLIAVLRTNGVAWAVDNCDYVWVRQTLAAMPCTLDGRRAHLSGFSCPSCNVWTGPDISGPDAAFSWAAVARIMLSNGGRFAS